MRITNPILPGFYPDPSVCRVGGDYFLVNSSFEYFPGVPIHHSRDLINWRQIGHCLTRDSQLPLAGAPASDGIYAPTIRHQDGRFYMVTTNIRGGGNFFVHTDDPFGAWSEPIWLKQRGIDPSLLFDGGKVFLTSNGTNWAPVRGIYQCEIDIRTGRQLTETRFLWPGTGGGYPESPHLFKRGGYYYLVVAEGGTAECHMVTAARSRSPYGPFDPCPHNPVLTHRSLMNEVQATGHADFFEDADGNWWAVFLGFRYCESGWHNLGRETYLAPVEWTADGWPVVNGGEKLPLELEVDRPGQQHPWPAAPARDDFDSGVLGPAWIHLRNPDPDNISLADRPGWLRLKCAKPTLDEQSNPAFAGRRQQHFECATTARIDFQPASENEEAGLTVLIDNHHHCEIVITRRNDQRCAIARRRIGPLTTETPPVPLDGGPLDVAIQADRMSYQLLVASPAGPLHQLASMETRYLSTQVAGGYTGTVFALFASSNGQSSSNYADFDWFEYSPTPCMP